jgi:guanylate kinase
MEGKLVIFSAPSGSGKSTIIRHLLDRSLPLAFSISATSRAPRGKERDGVEYYFLSPEVFGKKIAAGEFIEYEEVYKNVFYGTLKSEIQRIADMGKHAVFDIDVVGALNLKRQYGDRALSVFIQPPSVETLRRRLESRGTDVPEVIERRLERAAYELSFAPQFDVIVVNNELEKAQTETLCAVRQFLGL